MYTHQFWWVWSLRFRRYCYLQKRPNFPFRAWTIVHGHQKNLIYRNWLKKFIQVWIDVKCIHTNFSGCGLSAFGDIATLKNGQISLLGHGLYSPWSSKNLIDRNRLKKFMQVWIDVKCIHTNFGGRGISAFGDIATFKNGQISLLGHGL